MSAPIPCNDGTDAHDALTNPIARLPPEILINCFEYAVYPSDYPSHHTVHTPTRIARVCQTWRDVVLSAPSLWTHLVLSEEKFEDTYRRRPVYDLVQAERDVRALETHLERSRGLPLQLFISQDYGAEGDGGCKPSGYVDAVKTSLIPAIVAFINRCDVLVVRAFIHRRSLLFDDTTAESNSVIGAINGSKTLRELTFVARMHSGPRLRFELPSTLDFLRVMSLSPHFYFNSREDNALQIRHLEVMKGDSWLEFARIVHRFTHLETLELDVCQDFLIDASKEVLKLSDEFDLTIQTIPNLRYLYLTLSTNLILRNMNDASSAWTLLDFLDLPALVSLHIDFGQQDAPPVKATARIQSFFRRCTALRRLSFYGPLHSSVMIAFLRATPGLDLLAITEPFEDDTGFGAVLDALSETEEEVNGPRLCSRLKHVYFPDVESVSVQSMAKFCLMRTRANLRASASADPSATHSNAERKVTNDRRKQKPFEATFYINSPEDYSGDPDIRWCCESGLKLSVNADTLSC